MESEKELLEVARKYGWKWLVLLKEGSLSESFIEKFQDEVDWESVSIYQQLSEDFIKKFKDKVNWEGISYFQKLSEEFIIKFQDRIDWKLISRYQKLSEDFVLDNFSKIYLAELKRNKYFDFNNIKNKELKLLLELRGES